MSLKLLHTSDWHLGKKLFKTSRLPEQKLFLDWLIQVIIQEQIHGLIIAGDIFDTPHPPSEALKLYFDFLKTLTEQSSCEIFIISGNHDSGKFLEAPKRLLSDKKIHIVGQIFDEGEFKPERFSFQIKEADNIAEIVLLPYFRSYELLNLGRLLGLGDAHAEEDKGQYILDSLEAFFQAVCKERKNHHSRILVGHHLFGQYQMSGSEQGLSLSGLDTIPLKKMGEYFDYIALGHIHKTQVVSKTSPEAYYSGSPIPFRFSESRNKSMAVIEVDESGHKKTTYPIPCFRHLHTLETNPEKLEEDLEGLKNKFQEVSNQLTTLLEVKINLKDPQLGLADLIREKLKDFPIELLSFQSTFSNDSQRDQKDNSSEQNISQLSTEEYFNLFYKKKHPDSDKIPKEISQEFRQLIEESRHQEEEY